MVGLSPFVCIWLVWLLTLLHIVGVKSYFLLLPNPIFSILCGTTQDDYKKVNKAWLDSYEYTEDEVLGHTYAELNLIAEPEHFPPVINRLLIGDNASCELKVRSKTGKISTHFISATATVLNGELCSIFVGQDITTQKELEREVQRLDRLNIIGEMAASIGHEIRNPMTTVRGYLP